MSVTAARGFRAAGVAAGLKASGRPDLGLLVVDGLAAAAGLFTRNAFAAAPVELSRRRLSNGVAAGVVVNSGQANAGTGTTGMGDAAALTDAAAEALGVHPETMLACSTGMIGPRIPVPAAIAGVRTAATSLSSEGGQSFAEAILTTDSRTKQAVVTGRGFTVGGCAKGAGMIAPDLATLLVFLTTDAIAFPDAVRAALLEGAEPVWNAVTVDACPSTNDSVLLLASGATGTEPTGVELADAVAAVSEDLARQVVADAEGSTTTLVVQVDGAEDPEGARAVGRAVAGSALVKTALFGNDPNAGRILQAVGASGARFDPGKVEASLGGVPMILGGAVAEDFDREACARAMKEREVVIRVRLGDGPGSATAFGCDLGYEYVRINAEYST